MLASQQNKTSGGNRAVLSNSNECTVSALIGGGLMFFGLGRRSLVGLGLAGLGFYVLRNAIQGQCLNLQAMDAETEEKMLKRTGRPLYSGGDENSDAVEEASMESFPASDAPAYSRSA